MNVWDTYERVVEVDEGRRAILEACGIVDNVRTLRGAVYGANVHYGDVLPTSPGALQGQLLHEDSLWDALSQAIDAWQADANNRAINDALAGKVTAENAASYHLDPGWLATFHTAYNGWKTWRIASDRSEDPGMPSWEVPAQLRAWDQQRVGWARDFESSHSVKLPTALTTPIADEGPAGVNAPGAQSFTGKMENVLYITAALATILGTIYVMKSASQSHAEAR